MNDKTEEKRIAIGLELSSAEKQLIRDVYAAGASELEFDFFLAICRHRELNPFAGQMFLIPFKDDDGGSKRIPVVSIHGLTTIAARTGNYAGTTPVQFLGKEDDKWFDVWDKDDPPRAAKIGVYMRDVEHPTMAIATWKQSAKYKKGGGLRAIWAAYPADMLEKCALAKALRRAFPADAGGVYIAEEFGHAGVADITHGSGAGSPQNEHQQQASATAKAAYSDEEKYPFGKYKDEKWCDLPPDFLDWIMSNIKDKPDIQERAQWEIDKRAGKLPDSLVDNGDTSEDAPVDDASSAEDYRKRLLTEVRNYKDSVDKDTFRTLYQEFAKEYGVKNFADKHVPITGLKKFVDDLDVALNKELDGGV